MLQNRISTCLILLLLGTQCFSSRTQADKSHNTNICRKSSFFSGSSSVYSFCLLKIQPTRQTLLPHPGSQPVIQHYQYQQPLPPASLPLTPFLVSGGDIRSYSKKTIASHLTFAASHNMVYFYGDVRPFKQQYGFLKAQWLKVKLLWDIIRDESIPEQSWIAWVDDDLVFNNQPHAPSMLDSYINAFGTTASVIITTDTCLQPKIYDGKFNTGVILVKKNSVSRYMFALWWSKRPASPEDQEQYNPPNQYGLKLALEDYDYVASGDLKIAPQRSDWGNLNTFHIFDHWETDSHNGLAEIGDAAIQHPGIFDIARKHKLILQTLKATSRSAPAEDYLLLMQSSHHPEMHSFPQTGLEDYLKQFLDKFLDK